MARIYHGPAHLMDISRKETLPKEEKLSETINPIIEQAFISAPAQLKQAAMNVLKEEAIKTVYVDKIIEVIKEIPVEIIKEVKVIEERIVEKPIEIIKTIVQMVPVEKIVEVIKEIEVLKEIEKFVDKEIKIIPMFVKVALVLQSLLIIGLLVK